VGLRPIVPSPRPLEEGSPLPWRANVNYTGAGVLATDDPAGPLGGQTVVTVAGAGDVTGWTRDAGATTVRLTNAGDAVAIGEAAGLTGRKLSVFDTGAREGLGVNGDAPGSVAIDVNVAGDAGVRWQLSSSGLMSWGDGTGSLDVVVTRNAPGTLSLFQGSFVVEDGTITVTEVDANNAGLTDVLLVRHLTTGAAAAGIGAAVLLTTENAGGSAIPWGRVAVVSTDVTAGSEDGYIRLDAQNGGTLSPAWRFGSNPPIQSDGPGTLGVVGNARGVDAFDLQQRRTAATQVASGQRSILFGTASTASGLDATVIGLSQLVTVERGTSLGGSNHQVLGLYGTCAGGVSHVISGGAFGFIGGGWLNTVTGGDYGSAFGNYANADHPAAMTLASGRFTAGGDNQTQIARAFGQTTNNTPLNVGVVGTSTLWAVGDGDVLDVMMFVTAKRTDVPGATDVASFVRRAVFCRFGGAMTLVGAAVDVIGADKLGAGAAGGPWTATIVFAGQAVGAQVVGENGKTIRWSVAMYFNIVRG
jgi:hypothetical protein